MEGELHGNHGLLTLFACHGHSGMLSLRQFRKLKYEMAGQNLFFVPEC